MRTPPASPSTPLTISTSASIAGTVVLEVVAHPSMRFGHRPADRSQVAQLEGRGKVDRAPAVANDVPRPANDHRIEPLARVEHRHVHVAQGRLAEGPGGRLAPVGGGRCRSQSTRPRRVDVSDHDDRRARGQGDRAALARLTAVDREGVAGLPGGRDQLVHDAAVDADPLVLGPLAEQGHGAGCPARPDSGEKAGPWPSRWRPTRTGPHRAARRPDDALPAVERVARPRAGSTTPFRYSIQPDLRSRSSPPSVELVILVERVDRNATRTRRRRRSRATRSMATGRTKPSL